MGRNLVRRRMVTRFFVALVFLLSGVFALNLMAQAPPLTDVFELGDGFDPLVPGVADVAGDGVLPAPDWDDLFNADRSPKDVFDEFGNPGSNGVPDFMDTFGRLRIRRDGAFVLDDVSAGSAVDGSVFDESGLIGAGTVDASYDLGNAYAYALFDAQRNFVMYAGVERLSGGNGTIVLEFNQRLISLDAGGQIVGDRSAGDLEVISIFQGGILDAVNISRWDEVDPVAGLFDWVAIETLPIDAADPAEQCNVEGTLCAVCNGSSVAGGSWPSYGADGSVVTQLSPDTFMEFGINLTSLLVDCNS